MLPGRVQGSCVFIFLVNSIQKLLSPTKIDKFQISPACQSYLPDPMGSWIKSEQLISVGSNISGNPQQNDLHSQYVTGFHIIKMGTNEG